MPLCVSFTRSYSQRTIFVYATLANGVAILSSSLLLLLVFLLLFLRTSPDDIVARACWRAHTLLSMRTLAVIVVGAAAAAASVHGAIYVVHTGVRLAIGVRHDRSLRAIPV